MNDYVRPGEGFANCSIGAYEYDSPGPPAVCLGDCDAGGSVTVDELVTLVNIALGSSPVADCSTADVNRDGRVTIDELVQAVNAALSGCPGPKPRPSSTPTPTQTPGAPQLRLFRLYERLRRRPGNHRRGGQGRQRGPEEQAAPCGHATSPAERSSACPLSGPEMQRAQGYGARGREHHPERVGRVQVVLDPSRRNPLPETRSNQ